MTKAACFSASFIARARVWAGKLIAADLQVVRIASQTARSSGGQRCAVGISKLGNGWLYPFLAALILADRGLSGYRIIVLATANAALMHCLYPIVKQRFHRPRPFSVDPKLPSLLATLDVHSFPSGHVMTLTSVLVPIVILWPATAILSVLSACCLAWARVATAHHFPSDVFAGAILGVGVGYPISLCLISLW
ncbi:MAG TPA: phosphatase PAP2 family protein [Methylocystis sp.]